MWILYMCLAAGWAGCGHTERTLFDTQQECYESLKSMQVVNNGIQATKEDGKVIVAYCYPAKKENPKPGYQQ